jgi:hypothetical protein
MLSVKLQLVLFVALITLIVGSPMTYKLTDKLIGSPLKMPFVIVGVPTVTGQIVHAIVAGLLTWIYLLTFRV